MFCTGCIERYFSSGTHVDPPVSLRAFADDALDATATSVHTEDVQPDTSTSTAQPVAAVPEESATTAPLATPASDVVPLADASNTTSNTSQPTYAGRIIFDGSKMGGPKQVITDVTTGDELVNISGVPRDNDIKFFGIKIGKRYFVALTTESGHHGPDKVWLTSAPVKEIFPEGITGDVTLYPVIISSNDILSTDIPAHAAINEYRDVHDVLPGVSLLSENRDNGEVVALDTSANRYYVQPNAVFTWDDSTFALWAYFNPGGVLSNSAKWDEAPRDPQGGNPNNFTHTDLVISLDQRVKMKDEITLSFNSAAYKAIAVYAPDYTQLLSIPDPEIDNPTTTFTVNLQGNHTFIVRAALRNTFSVTGGMSVSTASQIFAPMTLTTPDSEAFWVEGSDAQRIAQGADALRFNGTIKPVVKHPVGVNALTPIEARASIISFDTTTLNWEKTDDQGNHLGGATFELVDTSGKHTVIADWVQEGPFDVLPDGPHDHDPRGGYVSVSGLALDTYTIKEITAPSGYILATESLTGSLTADARDVHAGTLINVAIPEPVEPTPTEDVQPPQSNTPTQNTNASTSKNKSLAKTGDITWVVPSVCASISVIVAGAGMLLRKRTRMKA